MFHSKISMEQFTQTVMEAVGVANTRVQVDYCAMLRQKEGSGFPAPPPLTVKNAKISFEATLSKQGGGRSRELLMLDFGKPGGNFRGEFTLDAFQPDAEGEDAEEDCRMPPVDQGLPLPPVGQEVFAPAAEQGQTMPPCATLFAQQC